MYILLSVERQFGANKRGDEIIFPADNIVIEAWRDGSGEVAPNCCKITCHGLAYKVLGRSMKELAEAVGKVKDLK